MIWAGLHMLGIKGGAISPEIANNMSMAPTRAQVDAR